MMNRTSRGRLLTAVSLVLLAGALGCGNNLYPVRGKVTFADGQPLPKGMVIFEGKVGDKMVMARGPIQADGSYELGTHRPGDGAAPGKYRVLVSWPEEGDAAPRTPVLDPRFAEFSTSGLEYEVVAGANAYPIQVSRPSKGRPGSKKSS